VNLSRLEQPSCNTYYTSRALSAEVLVIRQLAFWSFFIFDFHFVQSYGNGGWQEDLA